ncbi:unnamed protein product [Lymnaea stagnalis]|uniref:KIF-binding protein n=1 Tax=Lymnaea stagnalis TaxID=6523 RepID=A0AAV2H821_LYMST
MEENADDLQTSFTEFCKNILKEMSLRLDGDEMTIAESLYTDKCAKLVDDIGKKKNVSDRDILVSECLQGIAQFVLDLTYLEECKLVNEEFLDEASPYTRILYLIGTLSSIEQLAQKTVKEKQPIEVLGPEVVECIHWRNGALMYMYCHTLNSESEAAFPAHYQQCLEKGIRSLKSMLCSQCSPAWLTEQSTYVAEKELDGEEDDHSSFLYAQGILSSTHLLALMYCGEMCYWFTKANFEDIKKGEGHATPDLVRGDTTARDTCIDIAGDTEHFDKDNCDTINAPQLGQSCLEVYVRAATKQVFAGGWQASRAEEILEYFKTLNSSS